MGLSCWLLCTSSYQLSLGRDAMVHAEEVSSSGRLFSFGVISDIQYANIPDGFSFSGIPRYYR